MRTLRVLLLVLLVPAHAWAQACFDFLDRQTYSAGFQTSDFVSSNNAIVNGSVQLNVGAQALDINRIVLPFDQEVRLRFVYRNAAGSHTIGWFYLDQLRPDFLDDNDNLVDADGDGVADFIHALWELDPVYGVLPKLQIPPDYSDGGKYPHIPNLLERMVEGGGGLAFLITDDDGDTETYRTLEGTELVPTPDVSTSANDGIPDYDVNGDGIVGNEEDRTIELGTLRGNREIVFFATTYHYDPLDFRTFGYPNDFGYRSDSYIVTYFTKTQLNADSGAQRDLLMQRIAIGCERDDVSCYNPTNDPAGATLGWLDAQAIARLNTDAYNFLQLDNTLVDVRINALGQVPHFVLAAPRSSPNRWVVAFDDQPEYVTLPGGDINSCLAYDPTCSSDSDFNDVVFIIERTNGGQIVSQPVTAEIPPAELPNTTISRIRLRRTVNYPAPCVGPPRDRVDIYYSLDGGQAWYLANFPADSPNEANIDLSLLGLAGNQLVWRADFVSNIDGCQPVLTGLDVGYEALRSGEYQYSEPIPIANALVRGTFETASSSWTVVGGDRSNRGHLLLTELYAPDSLQSTQVNQWDAGQELATRNPDSRNILYNNNGVMRPFVTSEGPPLAARVLTPDVRTKLRDGKPVYDLNADGVVDDSDSAVVIAFTRGMDPSGVQRPWKLGAIIRSTPAVLGPVPRPWWLDGSATPVSERTAFPDFASQYSQRATLAIVGAQDGMIHAFDAGAFRYGDDPSTGSAETRGYFSVENGQRNYGTGAEVWAYIPDSQVDKLKNALPSLAGYRSDINVRPSVDGSIAAADVFVNGGFHTLVMAAHGRGTPYLTALDVSDPTDPQPVWAGDWSDVDFHGTHRSPSIAPARTSQGRRFVAVTSSGIAFQSSDTYLFLINISNGQTLSKIRLNALGDGSLGSYGTPALVDSDDDGTIDRAYLADARGRIYRVDTPTETVCQIADLGAPVFAPLALTFSSRTAHLFVGSSDNPDTADTGGPYQVFALDDSGGAGECRPATTVYTVTLGAGEKIWSAPIVAGDSVYFATSTGVLQDVCAAVNSPSGNLYGYSTVPDPQGNPIALFPNPITIPGGGGAVSGIRAYDDHIIVNTIGGNTNLVGAPTWNNTPPSNNPAVRTTFTTTAWYEE